MRATLEGRTIEYRPGGGLDYHNSPLMAEIPTGDYSHLHRSIDQLRSMNERGMFGPLSSLATTTDLRTSLVHDYKPINVSDLRNNNINVNDRLDYLTAKTIIDGRAGSAGDGNSNPDQLDLRHEQPDQKPYVTNNNNNSAPSTPPTPLSISEAQMQETKVRKQKESSSCHFHLSIDGLLECVPLCPG